MLFRPMLLSRACLSYCLPLAAVMTARRIWPLTKKVWSLKLPERPCCEMEQALNRVKLRCRSQHRTVSCHLMCTPHCLSPLYATLLVVHGSEALLMPDLFGMVVDRKALLGQQLVDRAPIDVAGSHWPLELACKFEISDRNQFHRTVSYNTCWTMPLHAHR